MKPAGVGIGVGSRRHATYTAKRVLAQGQEAVSAATTTLTGSPKVVSTPSFSLLSDKGPKKPSFLARVAGLFKKG